MKDMCAVRLYGGHKELAKIKVSDRSNRWP